MKYQNATLSTLSISAISSGVAMIAANGDDWVKSLAIGGVLVLIGMGLELLKYRLRKV